MKFINLKIIITVLLFLMVNSVAFSQVNLNNIRQKAKEAREARDQIKETRAQVKDINETTQGAKSQAGTSDSSAAAEPNLKSGHQYYIAPNGSGRVGSKEQPSRDLAVLISQLKDGDVVHIAAGTYTGKAGLSSDKIAIPITIIGGYSPDFSTRDPWGEYKTVFSGTNELKAATTPRLDIDLRDEGTILVDGIIFDNAERNRYKTDNQLLILRKANMAAGQNPTPNSPGLKIHVPSASKVIVKNCIFMNIASSQGALDVQIGKGGVGYVENNLMINNTGEGIMLKTSWHGADQWPKIYVKNNTILFSWKIDAIASYGGNSIMMDKNTEVFASDNVFGFSDFGGVNNIKNCKNLLLTHNLFFGHKKYDYQEYTGGLNLDEMVDYADAINPSSSGNFSKVINIPISKKWAEIYFSRQEISRAEVDAAAKVSNSTNNQIRGILGLPLQGSTVKMDADVWLHRLQIEDAVNVGANQYEGTGCQKPVAVSVQ